VQAGNIRRNRRSGRVTVVPMQRPYDLRAIADRAGSGDQPPPPPEEATCAGCGGPLPAPGRVFCARAACRKRWGQTGTRTRREIEAEPTIGTYVWDG